MDWWRRLAMPAPLQGGGDDAGSLDVTPVDVTLVTHTGLPGGAPDDLLFVDALRRRGLRARFAVWDDPEIDWSASPLAVVRSTWDYHHSPDRWLAWIAAAGAATTLLNAPEVVRWNTDKCYLRELAERGVACVPTAFVAPGTSTTLAQITSFRGWSDVVVKPATAASASGARRFAGDVIAYQGETHLRSLAARGTALVQPYLPGVENAGERSLVFVADEFVHAFTKPAFSADAVGGTRIEAHRPDSHELALAIAALAVVPGPITYARVDLVPDVNGLLLMELELIEPDLGLRLCPTAAEKLADACLAALKKNPLAELALGAEALPFPPSDAPVWS